jgi:hypothetical protein
MLRLALALALMVACAACDHPSPPSGTGSPTTPPTVAHPPAEFVAGPCPVTPQPVPLLQAARCGSLLVPENRTKPDGRTVRLAVAIVPSETRPPTADPIVFIEGGPGADAIVQPPVSSDVGLNRNRELILMGQRGNFTSQPQLTCPEIDQFEIRHVGMAANTPATVDGLLQATRECRDRLAP